MSPEEPPIHEEHEVVLWLVSHTGTTGQTVRACNRSKVESFEL